VAVSLSLAMIVKDEEATLGRALEDAGPFCDELVVVDTGSTDATIEVAARAGARVEKFDWIDDFAAARNYAFDRCTGDWIIWLDADDRVPPDSAGKILDAKAGTLEDSFDVLWVSYRYLFDEQGACRFSLPRERLVRRSAGLRWVGAVHEVIPVPPARSRTLAGAVVEHRPLPERRAQNEGRNLRILQRVVGSGDRSARNLFYLANELRDNGRAEEAVAVYLEFLAAEASGWERYEALIQLGNCLAELHRDEEARSHLLAAVALDSSRPEAYNRLGVYHYQREQWPQAIPFFLAGTGGRRPTDGFVNEADYGYVSWDYLAVCFYRVGDYERAYQALLRALPGNPDAERLAANAGHILRGLAEKSAPG
jgi:glycosyltransferase involved in cell wall biosynthesis